MGLSSPLLLLLLSFLLLLLSLLLLLFLSLLLLSADRGCVGQTVHMQWLWKSLLAELIFNVFSLVQVKEIGSKQSILISLSSAPECAALALYMYIAKPMRRPGACTHVMLLLL